MYYNEQQRRIDETIQSQIGYRQPITIRERHQLIVVYGLYLMGEISSLGVMALLLWIGNEVISVIAWCLIAGIIVLAVVTFDTWRDDVEHMRAIDKLVIDERRAKFEIPPITVINNTFPPYAFVEFLVHFNKDYHRLPSLSECVAGYSAEAGFNESRAQVYYTVMKERGALSGREQGRGAGNLLWSPLELYNAANKANPMPPTLPRNVQ